MLTALKRYSNVPFCRNTSLYFALRAHYVRPKTLPAFLSHIFSPCLHKISLSFVQVYFGLVLVLTLQVTTEQYLEFNRLLAELDHAGYFRHGRPGEDLSNLRCHAGIGHPKLQECFENFSEAFRFAS